MPPPGKRRAFSLIEILVVVLIIGILATLALPVIKRARNSAIEKTLMNDARQLVSAATTTYAENGSMITYTYGTLIGFNKQLVSLSSGNYVHQGNDTSDMTGASGDTVILERDASFVVGNPAYDSLLSRDSRINGSDPAKSLPVTVHGLVFDANTGALLDKDGNPM